MLVVSGISRTGHFVILIFPLTHFLLLSWSEGTTKKIRCITQRTLLTMLILFLGIALLTDILAVPFKSLVPYFFITVTLGLGCLLLTQHVDTDPDIEQL
jgi:hypothetical protein